jgi:membrane fusion protein (multidrug efflux system)
MSNPFVMNRFYILMAAGAVAVFTTIGCSKKEGTGASAGGPARVQKQVVEVIPIERRDLRETLTVVGSLEANESVEIRPEVAGLVRAIYFQEGQQTKAGEVLVKIDDAELLAQMAQIEARFKLAELNVARSENLSETRTIPQSDFDRARSEFAAVQAERSLLRLRLEKTEIKAPFDGILGARTISAGDVVTTSTIITKVDDLSRLKISFQVPERFLAKVRPGTQVQASTRLAGRSDQQVRTTGEVYFVSASIDRATRSSEVKASLQNSGPELRPGMFANVEILLDTREQVLTVPEGAILTDSRGVQIIIVGEKDGQAVAEYVPVETGLRTRGLVEVRPKNREIAPGTTVVASGVGALILFPGSPLEPRPLRSAFVPSS